MAITGINSNGYTSYYAASYTKTAQKADCEKDSTSKKESNVITSTVELKTSTAGVTKTEKIKTGYSNVNDYSKYLQDKYSYMNTGTISMQGVPTTVSVSSAFLQKCMKDPEKAKYLEENLAAIPDCVKSLDAYTRMMPGNPVCTYANYIIDDNGNISVMSGCTNDPDGKIARENAERKVKEKKAAQEKAAERRAEKKAAEEKAAKKRAEKAQTEEYVAGLGANEVSISATGNSVKSVTQSILSAITNMGAVGFDVKA
ncbi:MAG: hypothetical protein Q4F11_02160 [Eubacteriales bacterium]|nr:hypothetical protein [Eubacteriales bacterium]